MYKQYIDLTNVNDSMELDSNQVIAELVTGNIHITLEVRGDVKVFYDEYNEGKDATWPFYKYPSEFPDGLAELIHRDKEWFDNEKVYVAENNWFELFVCRGIENPEAYLVDVENYKPDQVAEVLIDEYIRVTRTIKESK